MRAGKEEESCVRAGGLAAVSFSACFTKRTNPLACLRSEAFIFASLDSLIIVTLKRYSRSDRHWDDTQDGRRRSRATLIMLPVNGVILPCRYLAISVFDS